MADLTGQKIGNYQIGEVIGRGGMATVYRAHQQSMDRDVAIKVMATELAGNPEFVARFEREARVIARLQHPHILPVIDTGRDGDYLYLVMRLVTGGVLSERLRITPLTIVQTERFLSQIASALEYAHRAGVIHRDLKPTNVLLDEQDNVYLTDFGIAKMLAGSTSQFSLTATGRVMGTPAYMAPEQWRSEPVDARTDIYALGVIVYEMLLGALPFNSDTPYGMMYKHFDQTPAPPRAVNPNIPLALEAVVLRALAKRPEGRYPSAQEMAAEYTSAVRTLPPEVAAHPLVRATIDQIERATPAGGGTAAPPGTGVSPASSSDPQATDYAAPPMTPPHVAQSTVARHEPERKGRSGLVIGVVALLLIAAVIVGAILVLGGGDDGDTTTPVGGDAVAGVDGTLAREATGAAGDVQQPTATATRALEGVALPTRTATEAPTETAEPTATHTAEPTATHTPEPTESPEPTATDTPEPTPTETPVPSDTPDLEATTDALLSERLTQTATLWTKTPTPDIEATVLARLTQTAAAWTDTPTHTPTATRTPIPTLPPPPTATRTPIPTVAIPTAPPLPTLVPTRLPTLTPFPTTGSCTMGRRLEVGEGARTTLLPDTPTTVRQYPGTSAPRERTIPPGLMFEVIEGPECANGIWWWGIAGFDEDGSWTGWIGEGQSGTYWVEPFEVNSIVCPGSPAPRLIPGENGRITTDPYLPNRVRSQPEVASNNVIGELQPGEEFEVISGPVCDPDGRNWRWWYVRGDHVTGWSSEGVIGEYWMEPWP